MARERKANASARTDGIQFEIARLLLDVAAGTSILLDGRHGHSATAGS